jgi:hypothetical protein
VFAQAGETRGKPAASAIWNPSPVLAGGTNEGLKDSPRSRSYLDVNDEGKAASDPDAARLGDLPRQRLLCRSMSAARVSSMAWRSALKAKRVGRFVGGIEGQAFFWIGPINEKFLKMVERTTGFRGATLDHSDPKFGAGEAFRFKFLDRISICIL